MTVALVAHTATAGNATGATSPAISTIGADLIVVCVNAGTQAVAVSDSLGNSYTLAASATGGNAARIYYCSNPLTSASHTVSWTGAFGSAEITAWSGVASVNAIGQTNSATSGSPGSVLPAFNGSLVICSGASTDAAAGFAINSGFTVDDSVAFSGGVNFGGASAYLIQSAAAAVAPSWSGPTVAASAIVVFNPYPAPNTSRAQNFYAVELTAFLQAGTAATPDIAWLATPYLALTLNAAPIADTTAVIRASDTGYRTREADAGGLVTYPPLLQSAFTMQRAINLDPVQSGVGAAWGALSLANPGGQFDTFAASWNSDGRPVKILWGAKSFDETRGYFTDPAYSTLTVAFVGLATPWFLSDTALEVPIRDATYWLDRNLQTTVYAGTGTYEGTADLAGKPKPKARGGTISAPIRNVTPLLIDPTNQIYQYTDGPGTVTALYEGGATGITFQADTTDLYSASTSPGQYRTDNSRGLFQLGSTPQRTITVDVTGQFPVAGVVTAAGQIARYLLTEDAVLPAENIDTASFVAPASSTMSFALGYLSAPTLALTLTQQPIVATDPLAATAGVWFAPDDITDGATAVNRVLSSIGAQIVPTRAGTLRMIRLQALAASAVPVARLTTANCVSIVPRSLPAGVNPPPFRFRVAYSHNYTVQSSGVSPSATAAWAQFIAAADRFASYANLAILSLYRRPNDTAPVGAGALLQSGDAQTVANALGALWSTRRRLYDVTLPVSVGLARDIGDVVLLVYPLEDLRGGKLGQIVGEQFASQNSTITFQVLV
jgi:hypothetical protein